MKVEELESRDTDLNCFALANWCNALIIISGGNKRFSLELDEVLAFNVQTGKWSQSTFPSMNQPRSHHSSCAMKGKVYVFLGLVKPALRK